MPGQDASDLLDGLVLVDGPRAVRIKSRALDVGREQAAVAVENVGPVDGGRDVLQTAAAALGGGKAERNEPAPNQHEGKREGDASQAEAVAAARMVGALCARSTGILLVRVAQRHFALSWRQPSRQPV